MKWYQASTTPEVGDWIDAKWREGKKRSAQLLVITDSCLLHTKCYYMVWPNRKGFATKSDKHRGYDFLDNVTHYAFAKDIPTPEGLFVFKDLDHPFQKIEDDFVLS